MKGRAFMPCGGALALLATVALLVEGCLIVPVSGSHRAEGSRGEIEENRAQVLRTGVTTREEVLLALGEPEDVLDGERVFVYRWARAVTLMIVALGGGGMVPLVTGRYGLRVEFDDRGLLKSVERSARECRAITECR